MKQLQVLQSVQQAKIKAVMCKLEGFSSCTLHDKGLSGKGKPEFITAKKGEEASGYISFLQKSEAIACNVLIGKHKNAKKGSAGEKTEVLCIAYSVGRIAKDYLSAEFCKNIANILLDNFFDCLKLQEKGESNQFLDECINYMFPFMLDMRIFDLEIFRNRTTSDRMMRLFTEGHAENKITEESRAEFLNRYFSFLNILFLQDCSQLTAQHVTDCTAFVKSKIEGLSPYMLTGEAVIDVTLTLFSSMLRLGKDFGSNDLDSVKNQKEAYHANKKELFPLCLDLIYPLTPELVGLAERDVSRFLSVYFDEIGAEGNFGFLCSKLGREYMKIAHSDYLDHNIDYIVVRGGFLNFSNDAGFWEKLPKNYPGIVDNIEKWGQDDKDTIDFLFNSRLEDLTNNKGANLNAMSLKSSLAMLDFVSEKARAKFKSEMTAVFLHGLKDVEKEDKDIDIVKLQRLMCLLDVVPIDCNNSFYLCIKKLLAPINSQINKLLEMESNIETKSQLEEYLSFKINLVRKWLNAFSGEEFKKALVARKKRIGELDKDLAELPYEDQVSHLTKKEVSNVFNLVNWGLITGGKIDMKTDPIADLLNICVEIINNKVYSEAACMKVATIINCILYLCHLNYGSDQGAAATVYKNSIKPKIDCTIINVILMQLSNNLYFSGGFKRNFPSIQHSLKALSEEEKREIELLFLARVKDIRGAGSTKINIAYIQLLFAMLDFVSEKARAEFYTILDIALDLINMPIDESLSLFKKARAIEERLDISQFNESNVEEVRIDIASRLKEEQSRLSQYTLYQIALVKKWFNEDIDKNPKLMSKVLNKIKLISERKEVHPIKMALYLCHLTELLSLITHKKNFKSEIYSRVIDLANFILSERSALYTMLEHSDKITIDSSLAKSLRTMRGFLDKKTLMLMKKKKLVDEVDFPKSGAQLDVEKLSYDGNNVRYHCAGNKILILPNDMHLLPLIATAYILYDSKRDEYKLCADGAKDVEMQLAKAKKKKSGKKTAKIQQEASVEGSQAADSIGESVLRSGSLVEEVVSERSSSAKVVDGSSPQVGKKKKSGKKTAKIQQEASVEGSQAADSIGESVLRSASSGEEVVSESASRAKVVDSSSPQAGKKKKSGKKAAKIQQEASVEGSQAADSIGESVLRSASSGEEVVSESASRAKVVDSSSPQAGKKKKSGKKAAKIQQEASVEGSQAANITDIFEEQSADRSSPSPELPGIVLEITRLLAESGASTVNHLIDVINCLDFCSNSGGIVDDILDWASSKYDSEDCLGISIACLYKVPSDQRNECCKRIIELVGKNFGFILQYYIYSQDNIVAFTLDPYKVFLDLTSVISNGVVTLDLVLDNKEKLFEMPEKIAGLASYSGLKIIRTDLGGKVCAVSLGDSVQVDVKDDDLLDAINHVKSIAEDKQAAEIADQIQEKDNLKTKDCEASLGNCQYNKGDVVVVGIAEQEADDHSSPPRKSRSQGNTIVKKMEALLEQRRSKEPKDLIYAIGLLDFNSNEHELLNWAKMMYDSNSVLTMSVACLYKASKKQLGVCCKKIVDILEVNCGFKPKYIIDHENRRVFFTLGDKCGVHLDLTVSMTEDIVLQKRAELFELPEKIVYYMGFDRFAKVQRSRTGKAFAVVPANELPQLNNLPIVDVAESGDIVKAIEIFQQNFLDVVEEKLKVRAGIEQSTIFLEPKVNDGSGLRESCDLKSIAKDGLWCELGKMSLRLLRAKYLYSESVEHKYGGNLYFMRLVVEENEVAAVDRSDFVPAGNEVLQRVEVKDDLFAAVDEFFAPFKLQYSESFRFFSEAPYAPIGFVLGLIKAANVNITIYGHLIVEHSYGEMLRALGVAPQPLDNLIIRIGDDPGCVRDQLSSWGIKFIEEYDFMAKYKYKEHYFYIVLDHDKMMNAVVIAERLHGTIDKDTLSFSLGNNPKGLNPLCSKVVCDKRIFFGVYNWHKIVGAVGGSIKQSLQNLGILEVMQEELEGELFCEGSDELSPKAIQYAEQQYGNVEADNEVKAAP